MWRRIAYYCLNKTSFLSIAQAVLKPLITRPKPVIAHQFLHARDKRFRAKIRQQRFVCCLFRDAFQLTTDVTSAYSSYCRLSSDQTSLVMLLRSRSSSRCFSLLKGCFSHHAGWTLDSRVWKSKEISTFRNTQPGPSCTDNHVTVEVSDRPFFIVLMSELIQYTSLYDFFCIALLPHDWPIRHTEEFIKCKPLYIVHHIELTRQESSLWNIFA